MSEYAERRALQFKKSLRKRGFGGPSTTNQLHTFLGDLVEVERTEKGDGDFERREDGGLRLFIPAHLAAGRPYAHCYLHELGHGLCDEDGQSVQKQEEQAELFRMAFLIPRATVRVIATDPEALLECADSLAVTPGDICRWASWCEKHKAPNLSVPAPWSAWDHFRHEQRYTTKHRRIVLTAPTDERFEWLCSDEAKFRETRDEIHRALLAVTPAEFMLQQAAHRTRHLPFEFPPLGPD